jgi:hypothetical protein
MPTPRFTRYIGIDYSGAETPTSSLKGLRVYLATTDAPPTEVLPPPGTKKYWTRKALAEWLIARLGESIPTIVGIDHAFSFPLAYFDKHALAPDWQAFLEDFHQHWPTDRDHVYVDFIRDGLHGRAAARTGDSRWRRVTEKRAGAAKSVFHFDVQGQVAKSTHSGLPWLLHIRRELPGRVHFWPFDGWEIAPSRSAIVEVYPALWSKAYECETRSADQHDAYSVARWLREADGDGTLATWLAPPLTAEDLQIAKIEGWILGVGETPAAKRTAARAADIGVAPASSRTKRAKLELVGGRQKSRERLVHRFLIALADTDPLVWRRVEVPEHYSFWDLHVAIQDAMGWNDTHLHEFLAVHPKSRRVVRIGIPIDQFEGDEPLLEGWKVPVSEYVAGLLPPMLYWYDFGDDWQHTVTYEGTTYVESDVASPRCVAGSRRCPPDDCGGPPGFRNFLAAMADPRHPEHASLRRWAGGPFNPADFDSTRVHFDDPKERWKRAFGSRR